eukprot:10146935-Karenia_brevis.AAC.1
MPHGKYHDTDVQVVYDTLDKIVQEGENKGYVVSLAGDWNAEVPLSRMSGGELAVGRFANTRGNPRGV